MTIPIPNTVGEMIKVMQKYPEDYHLSCFLEDTDAKTEYHAKKIEIDELKIGFDARSVDT